MLYIGRFFCWDIKHEVYPQVLAFSEGCVLHQGRPLYCLLNGYLPSQQILLAPIILLFSLDQNLYKIVVQQQSLMQHFLLGTIRLIIGEYLFGRHNQRWCIRFVDECFKTYVIASRTKDISLVIVSKAKNPVFEIL